MTLYSALRNETSPQNSPLDDRNVSSTSRFGDDVWRLDSVGATRHTHQPILGWRFGLPDGSTTTDAEHARLLKSCKYLFWRLQSQPLPGRRVHRGSTLVAHYQALRRLVLWMNLRRYRTFADLPSSTADKYFRYLRSANASQSVLRGATHILRLLSDYRSALTDGPQTDLLGGKRAAEFLRLGEREYRHIPYIPDDIAQAYVQKALDWIVIYGPEILRISSGYTFTTAVPFRGVSVNALPSSKNVHLPTRSAKAGDYATKLGRDLATNLCYACYVVIASHSGMRASEMAALQVDSLETMPSPTGGRPILLMKSMLYKTVRAATGEEARWVVGRDHPFNPVRLAVETLIALRRIFPRSNGLWPALKSKMGVAFKTRSFALWANKFAANVGLARPWKFTSHQFRKTFARWIVIHHRIDMLALRDHFKHISVAMTELYVGQDWELAEMIVDAALEEAVEQLANAVSSDRLAGRMGEQILSGNGAFRGTVEDARMWAREMIDNGLVVVAHPYGICVFNLDTARCRGEMTRVNVDTCLACPNACIAPEHRPFWEDMVGDTLILLEDIKGIGARAATQALEKKHADYSRVLRRISG